MSNVWTRINNADKVIESRPPTTYYTSIPVIQDRPIRRFDSARLKDLRKRLDTGMCEQEEIDQITVDLMDDCAEVSQRLYLTNRSRLTLCSALE